MITFDDFLKVEMKVGKVLSAEKLPNADKLLKLSVDFGTREMEVGDLEAKKTVLSSESDVRQVISGIALAFPDSTVLVGKKFVFVVNLEPRKIKGFESQAMILASGEGETFSLFSPTKDVSPGSSLR